MANNTNTTPSSVLTQCWLNDRKDIYWQCLKSRASYPLKFYSVLAKRLAGMNISKMTCFVSSSFCIFFAICDTEPYLNQPNTNVLFQNTWLTQLYLEKSVNIELDVCPNTRTNRLNLE